MTIALLQTLQELEPTGTAGFEGLVAETLGEIAGQNFGLMKSGPQGGLDGLTDRSNAICIGFEGKRYGGTTKLPLDALKAKIHDASSCFPALDLWVLAASRGVAANDVSALESVGDGYGVDVLVLDWDTDAALPALAVALASAPTTAARRFFGRRAVFDEIDRLRANPTFPALAERLRVRLTDAAIGYEAALRTCAAYLHNRMADTSAARDAFDSHAALQSSSARRISRPTLNSLIDSWWASDRCAPLALLGGEGVGKTWAALGWWLERDADDVALPLTLVVPARDVSGHDGPALLAAALHRATAVRDEAFWSQRLTRWAVRSGKMPSILFILDGLNQRWSFDAWAELVLSFDTPEWRGLVTIVMTCRPDHWHNRLGALPGLPYPAHVVPVGNFDDTELDALLALHGTTRSEFDPRMIDLLRVPRLSRLAIERRADLAESGEMTRERLIYEDWRHRRPVAQQVLTHEAFKQFIAQLARDANTGLISTALGRDALLERLRSDTGRGAQDFEQVLSELIDGSWLTPSGAPNRFELAVDRVPAALGLTLLGDLQGAGDDVEAEERFAALLDPLQGMDLAVTILRHAATFAMVDPTVGPTLRRRLLKAWLTSQNFGGPDFEAYWRLIGCDPGLVIAIAEDAWFGTRQTHGLDEALDKGFANAFKWPEVATPLIAKLVEWFSRYWPDGLEGEVLGEMSDDAAARKRRAGTKVRAQLAGEEKLAAKFGLELEQVEGPGQAWGRYRAAELLSWLPRTPFADVYTAWVITGTVMQGPNQLKAMEWNLRWFAEDERPGDAATFIPIMLGRAQTLLDSGGTIARAAAKTLLAALATPQARRVHDVEFGAEEFSVERKAAAWPPTRVGEDGPTPLETLIFLDADPADPDQTIQDELRERIVAVARSVTLAQLRAKGREDDGGFHRAVQPLARWAPAVIAELVNLRYDWVPPQPQGVVRRTFDRLRGIAPTNPPLQPPWAKLVNDQLALDPGIVGQRCATVRLTTDTAARHSALPLLLLDLPASEQIALLREFAGQVELPKWISEILAPLTDDDYVTVAAELVQSADPKALVFWLRYLSAAEPRSIPGNWSALDGLLTHQDAEVRAAALGLVYLSRSPPLAEAVARSGWTYGEEMSRDEAAYGSLALTLAPSMADGEALARVHPDALGELVHRFPDCPAYLDAFADHVRAELEFLRTTKSRSFPRSLLQVEKGWTELVDAREADFRLWLQPFFEMPPADAIHLFAFGEAFPLELALEAYDRLEPGSKSRFIAAILAEHGRVPGIRFGNLYTDAAKLRGDRAEAARDIALAEANDDKKLAALATGVQRHGAIDWLLQRIARDLEGNAAEIACGLTLAGMLAPDGAGDTLWSTRLKTPPTSGWLASVWQAAHQSYERGSRAVHWRNQFFDAPTDVEAFAAFELFIALVDDRLWIGDDRWRAALRSTSSRRRVHWCANGTRITAAIEATTKARDKAFLHSNLPLSGQAPKLS